MKRTTRVLAVAVTVVLVAGMAAAQGWQQQPMGQQRQAAGQYQPLLKGADDLIGMDVINNQGQTLGSLEDIVLEPNLNYISYGVLSSGGFVGIGENFYAIPWDAFQLAADQDNLILNIPQQAFRQAQGFDKDRWPDRADQRWRMQITGQQPMTQPPALGQQAWPQQQPEGEQQWRDQQYQEQQQWRQQQDQPQARSRQQSDVYGRPQRQQTQSRRQQPQRQDYTLGGGQQSAQAGFQLRRVSQLLGLDVQSFQQQEQLGDLADLVLDFQQGLVAYGVISLEGGDKAPVPWSAIEIRPQQELALVQADVQTLQQVAFSGDELPDLSNPQYAQQIHSQFNREPYWEVLGFVGGPQMQQQRMQQTPMQQRQQMPPQGQMQQEPLTRHFDPQNIMVISGTIESIGMFDDPQLAIQGQRLQIMTQDGETVTVHAGPRQFLQQQGLTLRENEQLQVRGSYAQIEGRTIFIASDIRTQQATVQLRNQQGVPLWRGMDQGMGRPQQQW